MTARMAARPAGYISSLQWVWHRAISGSPPLGIDSELDRAYMSMLAREKGSRGLFRSRPVTVKDVRGLVTPELLSAAASCSQLQRRQN